MLPQAAFSGSTCIAVVFPCSPVQSRHAALFIMKFLSVLRGYHVFFESGA
jgi:hypothetical protein